MAPPLTYLIRPKTGVTLKFSSSLTFCYLISHQLVLQTYPKSVHFSFFPLSSPLSKPHHLSPSPQPLLARLPALIPHRAARVIWSGYSLTSTLQGAPVALRMKSRLFHLAYQALHDLVSACFSVWSPAPSCITFYASDTFQFHCQYLSSLLSEDETLLTHPSVFSLCPLPPAHSGQVPLKTHQVLSLLCFETFTNPQFSKETLPEGVFSKENLTEFKTLYSLAPTCLPSIISHYHPVMVSFMCQLG